MTDTAERMAADIALTMNGGEWKDGKWYSKGHREAWIKAVQPYADEVERLREALGTIVATKSVNEINFHADAKMMWVGCIQIADAALKEKE